jgi:hypothetical protein
MAMPNKVAVGLNLEGMEAGITGCLPLKMAHTQPRTGLDLERG